MTQNKTIVALDLGATKCHAGIIHYDTASQIHSCAQTHVVKLADTLSLEDLMTQLETGLGISMRAVDAICIGAAGQYDGEYLTLEGAYPYEMAFAKLAKQKQWPAYAVIHDYAPIVCATFTSYLHEPNNIKRLNQCPLQPHGRRVALGLGTGLGLKDGVLFPNGDFWLGQNEIGHIGITTPPAADRIYLKRHQEIIRFMQDNLLLEPHTSLTFEKLLSGPGTVRLYRFFHPEKPSITPEEVGEQLRHGQLTEMLDTLAWYLGLFIGTVQLIFMPEGGIWVTGGVAIKHIDLFDRAEFFNGITASPAYLSQREQYPLGVLCNPTHALIGGGYYATKRLL